MGIHERVQKGLLKHPEIAKDYHFENIAGIETIIATDNSNYVKPSHDVIEKFAKSSFYRHLDGITVSYLPVMWDFSLEEMRLSCAHAQFFESNEEKILLIDIAPDDKAKYSTLAHELLECVMKFEYPELAVYAKNLPYEAEPMLAGKTPEAFVYRTCVDISVDERVYALDLNLCRDMKRKELIDAQKKLAGSALHDPLLIAGIWLPLTKHKDSEGSLIRKRLLHFLEKEYSPEAAQMTDELAQRMSNIPKYTYNAQWHKFALQQYVKWLSKWFKPTDHELTAEWMKFKP